MIKYFKVIWNRNVIDLLHYDENKGPTYVKFQEVHGIPLRCAKEEAQGFLSDTEKIYNTSELLPFPSENMYHTVTLEEILETEYEHIKNMDFKTAQEIRDELMLEILERGF
jgi:hypothetical protein